MGEEELPKVPCTMCKKLTRDDWMYMSEIVKADKVICGNCQQALGRKILDGISAGMAEFTESFVKKGSSSNAVDHES